MIIATKLTATYSDLGYRTQICNNFNKQVASRTASKAESNPAVHEYAREQTSLDFIVGVYKDLCLNNSN